MLSVIKRQSTLELENGLFSVPIHTLKAFKELKKLQGCCNLFPQIIADMELLCQTVSAV